MLIVKLLLLSVFLFMLTACGGGSSGESTQVPIVEPAPDPVPAPDPDPTPEPDPDPDPAPDPTPEPAQTNNVLVFSKTAAFRHDTISAGQSMLLELGVQNNWDISLTEDATKFNPEELQEYALVIWLNTTGDVLNEEQQSAFEDYIENGGGYLGIHAASDTEYSWPWYGELVGAYFKSHPAIQQATLDTEDASHSSTEHLPVTWQLTDEWYSFQSNPRENVNVLVTVDETSYSAGADAMGDHPISWQHTVGQGKAFYTGLGHTTEVYSDDNFIQHIEGAMSWAGNLRRAAPVWQGSPPSISEFSTSVLASSLNQPQELDIAENGDIYVIGRLGAFYAMVNDVLTETSEIEVNALHEGGLIGFVLDPNFSSNRLAYFHYTDPSLSQNNVSRIEINADQSLNMSSESILLSYGIQLNECCHAAGSLTFDSQGNLYIATGDNTSPFASDGYAPIDERANRSPWDAQKSSANTNDLRGKVLRVKPLPDGSYEIPEGNLFTEDGEHRGEIFTMGNRNPYRIAIDSADDTLVYADIGPDAGGSNPNRGPAGYDEINKTTVAGNFGWPYFAGNNEAYNDYDFATRTSGAKFDPNNVTNDSPNNTGAVSLPDSQASWITLSHRALMVAGVYRFDRRVKDAKKLPSYFDGRLLYWNFNNDQMFEAAMDGDSPQLRRWLDTSVMSGIIDGAISPHNNRLYLVSFGGNCCGKPNDAGLLVEVSFNGDQDPTPLASEVTRYAINAGGGNYTTVDGKIFQAEEFASGGNDFVDSNDVSGTDDDALYQSHHWQEGGFSYDLPIKQGSYRVILHFAETFQTEPNTRVFHVDAEDSRVLSDIDAVAAVGTGTAYVRTFDVEVTDNELNISFVPSIENPFVAGIEVSPNSAFATGDTLLFNSSNNGQYVGIDGQNSNLIANFESASNEQTFMISETVDGFVKIKTLDGSLFINVSSDGTIVLSPNEDDDNSLFLISVVEDNRFSLLSKSQNLYVGIDEASLILGTQAANDQSIPEFVISNAEVCEANTSFAIECRPNAKPYLDMPVELNSTFDDVPSLLSETGAFTNTSEMTPSQSLIPYELIAPLWSDRAVKTRWVSIPSGEKVTFSENDKWQWPAGTVFVKHFALPIDENEPDKVRRLETRLLVVREDNLVYGVTYKWRENNSDAELLTESLSEVIDLATLDGSDTQTWVYPTQDCLGCHNVEAKGVLGVKTASINSDFTYPSGLSANQLSTLDNLNIFSEALDPMAMLSFPAHANISDESKTLEHRVRSYWDINCASCHGPQGIAAVWDARYSTPLADQGVIRGDLANQRDYLVDYGLSAPFVVDPKNPDNSILYIRDKSVDPADRMPAIGKELEDTQYIQVLEQWINSLEE